jgi:riboflavin synthase
MFTGLVADIGQIRGLKRTARGATIEIGTKLDTSGFELGESVAVDGVCLTVTAFKAGVFDADASSETLARTTLAERKAGDRVHLERALRVGDRLGGHFVQGHVDGVATIERADRDGDAWQVYIALPEDLRKQVVEKGSIAVDGVSLTINELTARGLRLTVVPYSANATTLVDSRPGRRVNVETDVLGKYVRAALGGAPSSGSHTWDLLNRFGYTG